MEIKILIFKVNVKWYRAIRPVCNLTILGQNHLQEVCAARFCLTLLEKKITFKETKIFLTGHWEGFILIFLLGGGERCGDYGVEV